jgi:hypothetical protein
MRWTEIITIYLACGAPFAAMRAVRSTAGEKPARRLVGMLIAAIGWPITLVSKTAKRSHSVVPTYTATDSERPKLSALVEQLQRRVMVAMCVLREQAEAAPNAAKGDLDLIYLRVRESLDLYASLSLLSRDREPVDQPSESETEFFRVAGRPGSDLQIAARCLHRRNVSRLERHRIQARRDLIQDLRAVQNWKADRLMFASGGHLLQHEVRKILLTARDLFLLFDDRSAANAIEDHLRGEIESASGTEVSKCNTPKPQIRLSIQN